MLTVSRIFYCDQWSVPFIFLLFGSPIQVSALKHLSWGTHFIFTIILIFNDLWPPLAFSYLCSWRATKDEAFSKRLIPGPQNGWNSWPNYLRRWSVSGFRSLSSPSSVVLLSFIFFIPKCWKSKFEISLKYKTWNSLDIVRLLCMKASPLSSITKYEPLYI